MIYYRMNPLLKGGGGGYSETLLWTNPSPSADFNSKQFSGGEGGEIDVKPYKYLKFVYKKATNQNDALYVAIFDITIAPVSYGSSPYREVGILGGYAQSGVGFARAVMILYPTSATPNLQIYDAKRIGYNSSANSEIIPLEIYGVNIS